MRVHYGLVASGNQVIKDARFRDALNKGLGGNVLCVEMEAAGLNNFPCVVIRGICDYAVSHKNKNWQEHAAAVAAAFAKELLSVVPAQEVKEKPLTQVAVFGRPQGFAYGSHQGGPFSGLLGKDLLGRQDVSGDEAAPFGGDLEVGVVHLGQAQELGGVDQREKVIAAGANDYLVKPVNLSELGNALQRFSERRAISGVPS